MSQRVENEINLQCLFPRMKPHFSLIGWQLHIGKRGWLSQHSICVQLGLYHSAPCNPSSVHRDIVPVPVLSGTDTSISTNLARRAARRANPRKKFAIVPHCPGLLLIVRPVCHRLGIDSFFHRPSTHPDPVSTELPGGHTLLMSRVVMGPD